MNTQRSISPAGWIAGYSGLVVHGLLVVPLRALGLIAPMEVVYLLLATWAVLLVVAFVLLRRRPSLVPMIPLLIVVIAAVLVTIGSTLLGWNA